MKKSMNLFGSALYDYFKGDIHPFFLEVQGKKKEKSLYRYFRSIKQLSKIENKLISMCYGYILDIGCGTGNYIPALNKKGQTLGIDISEKIIQLSKKMGIENCIVADIYKLRTDKKFDTITLFENNLGLAKTIQGTKRLLKKLSIILKNNGQILIILSKRCKNKDFLEIKLTPIYKNIRGETFQWINFNLQYLAKLCNDINMVLEIISTNSHYSLVKITKI